MVLDNVALDCKFGELFPELFSDKLWLGHTEVLDKVSEAKTGWSYSIFILTSASEHIKERLKEDEISLNKSFLL